MENDLLFKSYLEERERADDLQDLFNKLETVGNIVKIESGPHNYYRETIYTKDQLIATYIQRFLEDKYELMALKKELKESKDYIKYLKKEYKIPETPSPELPEHVSKAKSVSERFLRMFKLK